MSNVNSGLTRAGTGSAMPRRDIRYSGSKRKRGSNFAPWPRLSTCPGTGRWKSTILRPRPSATGFPKKPAGGPSRHRGRMVHCATWRRSRINRTGKRRRETSTWSTGPLPVRWIGSASGNSTISSAMSGSGRRPPSVVSKVSRFTPTTMTFRRPLSILVTT